MFQRFPARITDETLPVGDRVVLSCLFVSFSRLFVVFFACPVERGSASIASFIGATFHDADAHPQIVCGSCFSGVISRPRRRRTHTGDTHSPRFRCTSSKKMRIVPVKIAPSCRKNVGGFLRFGVSIPNLFSMNFVTDAVRSVFLRAVKKTS